MYIHIGKGPPDVSGIWLIHKSDHPIQELVESGTNLVVNLISKDEAEPRQEVRRVTCHVVREEGEIGINTPDPQRV